jgi:DNA-directed RNA polymerase alpha subunit
MRHEDRTYEPRRNPLVSASEPVAVLRLGVRASNCLRKGRISTIGDLVARRADDLRRIRNLGAGTLSEIVDALAEKGLRLDSPDEVRNGWEPSPVGTVSGTRNGDILGSKIEVLKLGVRAINCLRAIGVRTVEELVAYEPEDLLRTRHLGTTTYQQIETVLAKHSLYLGMEKKAISIRMARTSKPPPADTTEDIASPPILSSDVQVLNLGRRASRCLQALGVYSVKELIEWNAPDLVRTPNFGRRTLQRIVAALNEHGLSLRELQPRDPRIEVFRQTLHAGLQTAEAELGYIVNEVIAPRKRGVAMLRLGWSGQRIRTLKELAKDPELSRLGKRVSRERIRQIESTGKRAIRHRLDGICPRRISEALRIVTESTPIAVGDVPDLLRKHGVSRVGLHYSGVRNAVELAGTEWPLVPLTTRGNRVLILTGERARYRRALRILSSTRPMAHSIVGQTARLARGRSAMATLLTRLIDAHPDYQWLDRDTGVYWHAPDGRPRRSNNILYQCRKLFSVCGRLHLDEIHGAIRRTRTGDELPPAHVLLEMIRQTNWCLIDGNYVQLRHDIRFDELTTTDRRVVRAVAGMGSTMAFAELRDNLMRQGITSSHAGQHIISSPFLYPVARGRYRILFHADDSIAALG